MQFVVAHGDVFHPILQDHHSTLNLHALQELALTTAVISRANCQGIYCADSRHNGSFVLNTDKILHTKHSFNPHGIYLPPVSLTNLNL